MGNVLIFNAQRIPYFFDAVIQIRFCQHGHSVVLSLFLLAPRLRATKKEPNGGTTGWNRELNRSGNGPEIIGVLIAFFETKQSFKTGRMELIAGNAKEYTIPLVHANCGLGVKFESIYFVWHLYVDAFFL